MRERVRNVLVGICTIGALGSAGAMLFLFGEIEPFFANRWQVQVALNEAGVELTDLLRRLGSPV